VLINSLIKIHAEFPVNVLLILLLVATIRLYYGSLGCRNATV